MLRKILVLLAVLAGLLTFNPGSALAACPSDGCVVDRGVASTTANGITVTTWHRIDYTNHKVRAYTRVNTVRTDFTITYVGPRSDGAGGVLNVERGGSPVVTTYLNNNPNVQTVTFASGLYSCPTSAGNYSARFVAEVRTSGGESNYFTHSSGTSSTTCGW